MENRIKRIMSDVLSIDINEINETSSPETIEKWDSLKHMNLVVALEEEFNLEFKDDEIAEIISYSLILYIIKDKLNK